MHDGVLSAAGAMRDESPRQQRQNEFLRVLGKKRDEPRLDAVSASASPPRIAINEALDDARGFSPHFAACRRGIRFPSL